MLEVGPFSSLQMELNTTSNVSFCTLSVAFVDSSFQFVRLSLATKAFPGTHTAVQVELWIIEVIAEFFGGMIPVGYKCSDNYIAGTVDQGGNVPTQ
jgi:hypothetical protein